MKASVMKKYVITLAALLALTGHSLFISSCGKSDAGSKNESTAASGKEINVRTEEIRLQDFQEVIKVSGSIESFNDVMIPAEEGGRVLEWLVPRGGRVRKGQVIARLDDAMHKAGFEAADAGYKLADVTYEKQFKVFEEQAISEWQMKSFEYQRDAARAQRDLAKARLDKTQIKSPIDGALNARFVDAGEMIGPGMPIAQVVENNRLRIAAGIPERYAAMLRVGSQVEFSCDALPGEKFTATVSFVGAAVARDSRTIPIEATIAHGNGKLKPEMIASLSILSVAKKNCIVIPQDYAQQTDMNRHVVFVDRNGIAEERQVTIGGSDGKNLLITNGLNVGDRLITLGFQNVANAQKINVQNQ